MKLLIKEYNYLILVLLILFSDILHYNNLSYITKILFTGAFIYLVFKINKSELLKLTVVFIIIYFSFLVGYLYGSYELSYFIFPVLIATGYILAQSYFNPQKFRLLFIVFLLLNAFALVYEKLTGSYIMDVGHPYSIIQGQGLFTWTKVQGEFLISLSLLFRKDRQLLYILLVSALLSGVRASVLLVGLLLALTYINSKNIRYTFTHKYAFIAIVASLYFILPVLQQTLTDYNIDRYTSMLDLESSTYSVREYVHDLHYGCIGEYNTIELLFGKGSYCSDLFKWGAESTFIHTFEYYGLIPTMFLTSLLGYVCIKSFRFKNYQDLLTLTVLLIFMWNWRFGFTYGGIFMWWYIFKTTKKLRAI